MSRNVPVGVAASLALVGALVVLGAFASPAVAENEGNITVERMGDTLELTVDTSANGTGEFDSLRLTVSNGTAEALNLSLPTESDAVTEADDETTATVDLFDLPKDERLPADVDLREANVTVSLERGDGSVVESTQVQQNLAAVRFDSEPVSFAGGRLTVNATGLVGVGDAVPIQLAGEANISATSERNIDDASWNLTVPLADSRTAIDLSVPFDVVAFPGVEAETTVVEGLDLSARTTAEITADSSEGSLSLDYGLIFDGASYEVTVAAADETETVEANSYGTLDLSEIAETVLLSGNTTLSVESDGASVVEGVQVPFDDSELFGLASNRAAPPERDGKTIRHELLFPGERYGVTIETDGPEGTLTLEVQANESGLTLPATANSALVAETVTLTVTTLNGDPLFEDESLDDVLGEPTGIEATRESQQLDVSTADIPRDVATVWLRVDGAVTRIEGSQLDASAGVLNLSSVDQMPDENSTVTMALFGSDGAVLDRLDVSVTGSSATESAEAGLITVPEGWVMPFGIGWFAVASVFAIALGVLKVVRVPVIGEAGGYGLFALLCGNALALSFLVYFLEPRVEFGLGVVGGTSLVMAAFLLIQQNPQDVRALLLALVSGTLVTGVLLVVGDAIAQPVLGIGIGTGYGTLAGGGLALWTGKHRSDSREQATETSGSKPVDVRIRLVDEITGEPVDAATEVTVRPKNGANERPLSVNGGTATGSLQPGTWIFKAETATTTVDERKNITIRDRTVQLAVPGTELRVLVQTDDGAEIPNADVHVESQSYTDTGTTRGQGTYRATLPAETTTVEISAEHELYDTNTVSVDASYQDEKTVTLEPRVGQLRVATSLGRDPVSGVSVTAERQTTPARTESGTTNERGVVTFRELLIGRYDLDVGLPTTSGAFTVTAQPAVIKEGSTERRDVTINFEYSLSREHSRQIQALRGELDEIAESSRRDDTIQGYYASVLHAVLDEVERVPQSGHPFLEHNTDPDAAVEALLTATEEATATLDTVLSSQRNVNLFSACSDLPGATVRWRGEVDIATLLQEANKGVGQQRAEVNSRLEAVDEQITAELRELAEVSPAREMWEGIREMLRDQSGLDEMEVAASIFVALLILDAVESVFEHRELRKRLEQTVY